MHDIIPQRRKPRQPITQRLQRLWKAAGRTAHLMIGVPDYDVYVEHCRRHHPDRPPMDRQAFFRNRLDARYGGANGGRCC
ncbi:MAG: YbdD/YjiX family protein [Rhodospirillales bacterium]|nr:YbdD/YjiX family protein [Rhodospirillales bacterium]